MALLFHRIALTPEPGCRPRFSCMFGRLVRFRQDEKLTKPRQDRQFADE